MRQLSISILILLCLFQTASGGDTFEKIKQIYGEAGCIQFDFMSILESDIFDSEDTAFNRLVLADDGQYLLSVGTDQYLFDLTHLYTYSETNAQIVIETSDPDSPFHRSISFIKHFDEIYSSQKHSNNKYLLTKLSKQNESIPDSLLLTVAPKSTTIAELEYTDINGEKNRIVFLEIKWGESCPDSIFIPVFPDGVEVIKF